MYAAVNFRRDSEPTTCGHEHLTISHAVACQLELKSDRNTRAEWVVRRADAIDARLTPDERADAADAVEELLFARR